MLTLNQNKAFEKASALLTYFLKVVAVILLCLCIFEQSFAQPEKEQLYKSIAQAKNDSTRIVFMGKLAGYYLLNRDEDKCDSVIEKRIMLAEASGNRNLIILSLFDNPRYNFSETTVRNVSTKCLQYITRALEYAKTKGLNDEAAFAYSNLAVYYNAQGNTEEALRYANLGYATAQSSANDSVKVTCILQLGKIFMSKSEILMAFKTFTNALDIAAKKENSSLLTNVYHEFSDLYKKLDQREISKSYIFKSIEINKENKNTRGLIEDYVSLGKLYSSDISREYLQRAEQLADSIKDIRYSVRVQKILFAYKMLEKKPDVAIKYLNDHPALMEAYKNTGTEYLTYIIGEVYLYGKVPDTALRYFYKAKAAFDSEYDLNSKKNFYAELAQCYLLLNKTSAAIESYQIAFDLSKKGNDLNNASSLTRHLKSLYGQQGDYKKALYYSDQFEMYKDSISLLAKDRDVALLEIANENKQRERAQELVALKIERRHNLQYMAITVAVATAFILLLAIGMFKVSEFTIRILGFFSFIFLFEFILMLLDRYIHYLTHGEPFKVWLIKIGIISAMFPVHHYLEEKLIHYLISRKLLEIRNRLSFKNLIKRRIKNKGQKKEEGGILVSPSHTESQTLSRKPH